MLRKLICAAVIVAATVAMLQPTPVLGFRYWKTITDREIVLADAPLLLTQNRCTIDEPHEIEAYRAGINEWNAMSNVGELFRDHTFSTDCGRQGDGTSEVILVRSAAIDGASGKMIPKRRLRDGVWDIAEADILIATDSCGEVIDFATGTNRLGLPEWTPECSGDDTFGTYLHELGHAIGLEHDSGEQANLMSPGPRIPRVGDRGRQPRPFGDPPVWAAVLPDERAAARQEYGTGGSDIHWFASAQYFAPDLGMSFARKASEVTRTTFTSSFQGGAMNWISAINRDNDGDRFATVFAEVFLGGSDALEGFRIKACGGDELVLPFSMGYGDVGSIPRVCHGFSLVDAGGNIATTSLGRMSECGLVARSRFSSGVTQVKLAQWLEPGVYRVFYNVNTCDETARDCDFIQQDGRTYDDSVETQIRIRVQSHAENPDCEEDTIDGRIHTFCLAPLSPTSCSSDADCVGAADTIEAEYEARRAERWTSMNRNYVCLPAVGPGSLTVGPPTFTNMTCQCPEAPPPEG